MHEKTAIPSIHQRMFAVMASVNRITKGDKKVNNQYSYVSQESIIEQIRPALIENGIFTVVSVESHTQDGPRCEVTIIVDFVNVDNPDDKITVRGFGHGVDPSDKGPGKAISYAVKYIFLKNFCIETGENPDRKPHEPQKQHRTEPKAEPAPKNDTALIDRLNNKVKPLYGAVNKQLEERGLVLFNEPARELEAFVLDQLNKSKGGLRAESVEHISNKPHEAIFWIVTMAEKREEKKVSKSGQTSLLDD